MVRQRGGYKNIDGCILDYYCFIMEVTYIGRRLQTTRKKDPFF